MTATTLGDISSFITKGATPTTYGFKWEASGIPFLRSECVSDRGIDLKQSMFISRAANEALKRSQVANGDILITITGNVGRVIRLTGVDIANINQHIARVRVKDERFDSAFVFHYLSQRSTREYYESIVTGQAYPQISLAQVRETAIPILPIEEQQRIAEALDSADDATSILDRLIAKKQASMHGMAQQLLTGITRFPGFSDPWGERVLGDVARIKTGSRNNQDKNAGGRYPFFVRSAIVERIDSFSYDCEAILIPGEGGIGSIFHYIDGKFEVHQRVYKISEFVPSVRGRFVYYYMRQHFGSHAMANSVKATVDSLRLPTFRNFQLGLPGLEEQDAIVAALDDAESELNALRGRLAKARAVKTGMMQKLLTGISRVKEAA